MIVLKNFILASYLSCFLVLLVSCAINPNYTKPDAKLKEQSEKYPQNSEQIQNYQREYENYQHYNRMTEDIGSAYQILSIKDSSWFIGNPDHLLGIGHTNYHYLHKINLSFICGKMTFDSQKYSFKKIRWELSDEIKGEDQTNLAGKISLIVKSEKDKKFDKITVTTKLKSYTTYLGSFNVIELDQAECER